MAVDVRFSSQVRGNPGTLSVCLIVKNESALLDRCLRSVSAVADEMIVVDTGSTDDTVALAEGCGARVIRSEWRDDFSWSRNISLRAAACQWILWLDADDVVPPQSLPLIALLKQKPPDRVFGLVVRNQKPGNTGSEFVQARMFPNHPDLCFERRIHEQIMFSADRAGLKLERHEVVIEHHGYADPVTMAKKARRNTELLLREVAPECADPVLLVEIADSYTILEEFDSAAAWYEKVLAVPGCAAQHPVIASHAHMGLGNILNRREEFGPAAERFRMALVFAPDRPDALYSMAVSQEMLGRVSAAIDTLIHIIEIPERPIQVGVDFRQSRLKAFLRVQRLLVREGRLPDARAATDAAIVMAGHRPEVHNANGALLIREGKPMEALRAFEQSLAIVTPGNVDAYAGLMVIYRKAGRNELVDQTIAAIRPLFADHPRFRAMCQAMGVDGAGTGIGTGELGQERKYLGEMFGL